MLTITYSGKSQPSAEAVALAIRELGGEVELRRHNGGDINWGRAHAGTTLNGDISPATNKRLALQTMNSAEVPTPQLMTVGQAVDEVLQGRRVVGRTDTHTGGKGLWKCSDLVDIKEAYEGGATHFMSWIEAPKEYRVHIFKGKSIRISEKQFTDPEHSDYVTVRPRTKVAYLRKAAKAAVAALGVDFGAVDVLADGTHCWVLEVNTAHGLGGSMPRVYAEAFLRWSRGEWDE